MYARILLVLVLAFSAACSSGPDPVDLTGSWETTSESPLPMTALISNGAIELVLVEGTTHGLYWVGTVPDTVVSGETFLSDGDQTAMDASLFGSSLDEKEFTYASDQITFEFTIMGITQLVTLERV